MRGRRAWEVEARRREWVVLRWGGRSWLVELCQICVVEGFIVVFEWDMMGYGARKDLPIDFTGYFVPPCHFPQGARPQIFKFCGGHPLSPLLANFFLQLPFVNL